MACHVRLQFYRLFTYRLLKGVDLRTFLFLIDFRYLISVDDDIDGVPLEKLASTSAGLKPGGFIPSKWETVDPDQVTDRIAVDFSQNLKTKIVNRLKLKQSQQANGTLWYQIHLLCQKLVRTAALTMIPET